MWTCPECRRRFANRSQWHACTDATVDEHLAGKSALAVGLYRSFEEVVAACGPFRRHTAKTRIAFIARMSFAAVTLQQGWVDVGLILDHPVDSPRVRRLDVYGPSGFGHRIRIDDPAQLDDELQEWACRAHRRGQQVDRPPGPAPAVTGAVLARTRAAFRSRLVAGPALTVPRHVVEAFAACPAVTARVGRVEFPTVVAGGRLPLRGSLRPQREWVDVTLRPRQEEA